MSYQILIREQVFVLYLAFIISYMAIVSVYIVNGRVCKLFQIDKQRSGCIFAIQKKKLVCFSFNTAIIIKGTKK